MCLERLRRAAKTSRIVRNRIVLKRVEAIVRAYMPRSVLLYLPMEHEVDPRPLLRYLRRRCTVFVPFMEGESFKLVQYRLPLRRKRFGIEEPNNSHFYLPKIDLAVVPVVGVDGRLRRIGFGKGMYDRFFASLEEKPLTLFVQLSKCYTKEKITDSFDVQADIYITPEDIIVRGKTDVDRNFDRRCRSNR